MRQKYKGLQGCLMSLFIAACHGAPVILERDSAPATTDPINVGGKADYAFAESAPLDFPAAQDLAVIFPLRTEQGIDADTLTLNGERLLSRQWYQTVSDAYADTEVADAFEMENRYEQWRIVALRFVPCGPLGIRPDQDISELCWPQVRLVWQPVIQDIQVTWMMRPFYADDRAIHALYRVMPEASDSEPIINIVKDHLVAGNSAWSIPPDIRSAFIERRNSAISRLFSGVLDLRGDGASGELNELDVRFELYTNDSESVTQFTDGLRDVLSELCEPSHLFELTSFSLPEGRTPASLDHWSFVAFDGVAGELVAKPIEVIGSDSGNVIGHAGFAESVGVGLPDPELIVGLDDSETAGELEDSVIFSTDDIERLQKINDPNQVLVPNTSCASCHSFNELRFNFHSLSHFEDRDVTIAPRVVQDVASDLDWLRAALSR